MRISSNNDLVNQNQNQGGETSKDWSEVECMFRLKEFCKHNNIVLPQNVVFMFACFHNFDFETSRNAIKRNHNNRLLHLKMEGSLLEQLQATILFPLAGLLSKDKKSQVLYFRQSRFMPSNERNQMLLENFCYCLKDMGRTEDQCRNGLIMIVNVKGFIDRRNLDPESIALFAQAVEGRLMPVKMRTILIVGATPRFENSWKQIKALLSGKEGRFLFLRQNQLGDYLMDGYEQYLPNEIGGCRDCMEISEDYVDLKCHEERLETERASDLGMRR